MGKQEKNTENLLENMVRDARINYDKTNKPYWLGRYESYYEMYQINTGKKLIFKIYGGNSNGNKSCYRQETREC